MCLCVCVRVCTYYYDDVVHPRAAINGRYWIVLPEKRVL